MNEKKQEEFFHLSINIKVKYIDKIVFIFTYVYECTRQI